MDIFPHGIAISSHKRRTQHALGFCEKADESEERYVRCVRVRGMMGCDDDEYLYCDVCFNGANLCLLVLMLYLY